MTDAEIKIFVKRCRGYWPNMVIPKDQKELWRKRLRNLELEYVLEAIDRQKSVYGIAPELSHIVFNTTKIRYERLQQEAEEENIADDTSDMERIEIMKWIRSLDSTVLIELKRRALEQIDLPMRSCLQDKNPCDNFPLAALVYKYHKQESL